MSRRKRSVLEMGHDSFLDIIANLVGIMIILVVILGTQSQQAAEDAAIESVNESKEVDELKSAAYLAAAARKDVANIRQQKEMYDVEILSRARERSVLLDLLNIARERWEEKKHDLTGDQQEAAKLAAELAQREKELQSLNGERTQLLNSDGPVVSIEHLPSPMAKTVFGEEVHLRLRGGLISVVPIESLVEAIREEFRRGVGGTRPGSSESTVGPIRGYVANFELDRTRLNGGTVVRLEMTGMTIVPISEPAGEPLKDVLDRARRGDRTLLDIELAGLDPSTTTVTVWVYPDSFREFRSLKEYLYSRGIATAARPLPGNQPISGGPQGSRSSAQ